MTKSLPDEYDVSLDSIASGALYPRFLFLFNVKSGSEQGSFTGGTTFAITSFTFAVALDFVDAGEGVFEKDIGNLPPYFLEFDGGDGVGDWMMVVHGFGMECR